MKWIIPRKLRNRNSNMARSFSFCLLNSFLFVSYTFLTLGWKYSLSWGATIVILIYNCVLFQWICSSKICCCHMTEYSDIWSTWGPKICTVSYLNSLSRTCWHGIVFIPILILAQRTVKFPVKSYLRTHLQLIISMNIIVCYFFIFWPS